MTQGDLSLGRTGDGLTVAVKAGQHFGFFKLSKILLAGVSKFNLPRSTCCMAAAPVKALVMEAIQTMVSIVIGLSVPTWRLPKAPS